MVGAQNRHPAGCSVNHVTPSFYNGFARVTVEVSGPFEFLTGRLHNPERAYFDILNSSLGAMHPYSQSLNDGLLSEIRVSDATAGVTRIILNLAGHSKVTSTQSINPSRLIIELANESAGTDHTASSAAAPRSAGPLKPDPPEPTGPRSDAARRRIDSAGAGGVAKRGDATLTRALGLKIRRVVLDPGHGGRDGGTAGPKGLQEKEVVLDVANRLGRMLIERKRWEVIYTRTGDTYTPLEARMAQANASKADLFLSIHANSSPQPQIAGVETYYLTLTDAREDLDVARRENASSQESISELPELIKRVSMSDWAEESHQFAKYIQGALAESCESATKGGDRGVKTALFVVLIDAEMPSVLAEVGFLSNPAEAANLSKPGYRQKLAEALYDGLDRYAQSLSRFPGRGK